jgi:sporadic carbohydrate cluster protein (TIGR04323 family)
MPQLLNGYVTVRPFGGFAIPVPVQNGILRDYAGTLGLVYALPHGEHMFENCHMQLFSAIASAGVGGAVGMCSLFMMPETATRFRPLAKAALARKVTLHCAFERLALAGPDDFAEARQRMLLRRHTDRISSQGPAFRNWLRSAESVLSL